MRKNIAAGLIGRLLSGDLHIGMRKPLFMAGLFVLLSVTYFSCGKKTTWWDGGGHGGHGGSSGDPSMLLVWNDAATQAVARMGTGPDGPLPPMPESRIYAMVNLAMHDALNSVKPQFRTYALSGGTDKNADPDAAVAKAAHDVLAALLPPMSGYADSLYTVTIAMIPNGPAKTKGIGRGAAAAAAMMTRRAQDGAETAQIPYVAGTFPGQYRPTPPFDGAPFNGFVAVPAWGKIKPFALSKEAQFRPGAPYPVNSKEYTADYNEAKSLGAATGSARTADQTEIGLFWLENSPLGWNRIARDLIIGRQLDAWDAARLLGLLHMVMADANISSFDAKFYYNYWRPVTAARLGNSDGNSATTGDPGWDVLAPPTPPIPDYPSNHAVNGGAAAELLKDFFGKDNIHFAAVSSSLPNVTRNYKSFSQAARDNSLSRIYAGYHFRNAVITGEGMGKKIGDWAFDHALRPQ
jgi:hypothetical protein